MRNFVRGEKIGSVCEGVLLLCFAFFCGDRKLSFAVSGRRDLGSHRLSVCSCFLFQTIIRFFQYNVQGVPPSPSKSAESCPITSPLAERARAFKIEDVIMSSAVKVNYSL